MFIITRYGFIVNRQTWKEPSILQIGVITLIITIVCQPTRYITGIIYFISGYYSLGYTSKLCRYFGHHDPSSCKPLGHFQVLICRNKLNKAAMDYAYNRSQRHGELSVSSETNMLDGMRDKVFTLSYYKAL